MTDPLLIWGMVLIVAALVMVVIEVFVPSAGIISLISAALAIGGLVCLFKVDWRWGAVGTLAMLILAPIIFFVGLQIMPSTPLGKRMLFGEGGQDPANPDADRAPPAHALARLVGLQGECLTDLRPVGSVRLELEGNKGTQRLQAMSEVGLIPAGTRVRVIAVDGIQVKVRPVA